MCGLEKPALEKDSGRYSVFYAFDDEQEGEASEEDSGS
jgi:hypothetical protein